MTAIAGATAGRPRLLVSLVVGALLCVSTVPARAQELSESFSLEPTATPRAVPSVEIPAARLTEPAGPAWSPPPPVKPAINISSESAALAYWLGRKLTQESRFDEAVTEFTKAVLMTPTLALAFNARAYAYIRLKRFAEAVADLDRALDLNPAYVNAYQNRSVARRLLGNRDGAEADSVKAKELLAANGPLPVSGPNRLVAGIWPAEGRVTSGFGRRLDPFSHEGAFHYGIDIDAQAGDPVRSAADGVVIHAGEMGGYGRLVVVDHGGNTHTWYAHLATINVIVGQAVHRAQVIGAAGRSGHATGPHLHYEVRIDGVPRDPYLCHPSLARRPQRITANGAVSSEQE